jgi:TRAP-type C4-dicarboxylate transport system permease small subunit
MSESKKASPQPKAKSSSWFLRNSIELVASFLCAVLTIIVFLQVLFRYGLRFPLDWAEEFAMVVFQWVSFIGAGIAVRRGFHFHVDLFTKRLPNRWQIATELLSSAAILAVGYILLHVGIKMMEMAKYITLPVLYFSKAYVFLAIPIGGALMIIYQIPIAWNQIRKLRGRG